MPATTGRSPRQGSREASLQRDETRRDQLALLLELREVEHWRRLVAARLDLAVAAVAGVDEPVLRGVPAAAPPFALRELLGLTGPGSARDEVALLLRLRAVQRDLDAYACALRLQARAATRDLVTRLDDRRPDDGRPEDRRPEERAVPDGFSREPDTLAPVVPLQRSRRTRRGPDDVA